MSFEGFFFNVIFLLGSLMSFMYVNATIGFCVFRRAFLFTDFFFLLSCILFILQWFTQCISQQILICYVATSSGFNGTLDPAFKFFDYFAVVCHDLQYLFLYNFVHVIPGSDLHAALAVHELQHQAISFFLDTNHILVFENVSLDYHVKLAA